ncbi:MAG: tRNA (guanosine(46)-N(7))-methyltransferase TrmB [Pseudobdellovibrionaceae bacterium]
MENSEFKRPRVSLTRNLKIPNYYTAGIDGEFRDFAFNEERAPLGRGKWRSDIFQVPMETPIDLEIGTGNGTHFQHHALKNPDRRLVGLELKYKPLIQSIRGCLKKGAQNARICRYHAMNVDLLFEPLEINDVFIHFPDPWVTPRKPKNRFVNSRVLDLLWGLQRPGSFLNFKTDSREYFLWSMEQIRVSKYKIIFETTNLHQTEMAKENFITQFESIFMRQGIEINFVRLQKV